MDKNVMPGNPAKDGVLIQTIAVDLPPPHTTRWVPRRKAAIVYAVRSGAISLEEVCRRYQLSVEEFLAWQRAMETRGVAGLRVTRLQLQRDRAMPAATPVVGPEALGGRRDEAGASVATECTVGQAHRPSPQGAQRIDQIERCLTGCQDAVRDQPVGRRRAPGIGRGTKSTHVSFPVEMLFEDAVTTDGGPLHLPRPDPVRSLFGCATARCHE